MLSSGKRVLDLAIAAGRRRQSPRTGFIHLHYQEEKAVDTVPLYENFLFAWALFRSKMGEALLEGKALLEKLLAFQLEEGTFPLYLHEYPCISDTFLTLRIVPILIQIERAFSPLLGSALKEKMALALERGKRLFAEKELSPLWDERYQVLLGKNAIGSYAPVEADQWLERVITLQLLGEKVPSIPFHKELALFLGGKELQEGGEPAPWAIEWALAEPFGLWGRHLQDHRNLLKAVALLPLEVEQTTGVAPVGSSLRWLWREEKLHSLSVPAGKLIFSSMAELFVDLSPVTTVTINGGRGTLFRLGDLVEIKTPKTSFQLSFHLFEGEGDFIGKISRANRPGQTAAKEEKAFDAFDWRICFFPLRATENYQVEARLLLSTASPITCIPLST